MFIFSNLATSLDGKIATTSREYFALGTAEDRRHMQRLRSECDVVLFGASSLRTFQKPCIVSGPAARTLKQQPANAIVSSVLEGISPQWPFFTRRGFHRILFVGPRTTQRVLARFEKTSEIVALKKPTRARSTAVQIIQSLQERGYRRILVEGGGSLMWDFVREDLIDEYHLTMTPRLIGGTEAPTLVDGLGFAPKEALNLKLHDLRRVGNELYLVYRKTGRRG